MQDVRFRSCNSPAEIHSFPNENGMLASNSNVLFNAKKE